MMVIRAQSCPDRFLRTIDRQTPADLDLHLVLDNYAAHKTPTIQQWLLAHPRFHPHFTPTYSSWLNLVERWFAELTNRKLRRSTHRSVAALEADVQAWIEAWNANPKPFIWTKTADQILETIAAYCQRINGSGHQMPRSLVTPVHQGGFHRMQNPHRRCPVPREPFGVRTQLPGVTSAAGSTLRGRLWTSIAGGTESGVEIDCSASSGAALAARHRRHVSPGRPRKVFVRLSDEEFQQVEAAAGMVRLTPSDYAGEVTVAAARAAAGVGGPGTGSEPAVLQRELFAVRTALVGAAVVPDADRCSAAVDRVDELADRLHGCSSGRDLPDSFPQRRRG
jgi:transposase